LISVTLGCNLPSAVLLATPTPTETPPQATPIPIEPANALEAQVEAVYDQAGSAVVNVTSINRR